jgi:hypothetical protein
MKSRYLFFLFFVFYTKASFAQDTYFVQDSIIQVNRLNNKISELKAFLNGHPNYNQTIAILIDFKQFSGHNRLFVFDLNSNKIIKSALVAHGAGSETGNPDSLVFSNIPNSYKSSIGKYKIGVSYYGSFGKSYKLHGLDNTNSKAFERFIVLHKYDDVPDLEQDEPIVNSLGCPMVSPATFDYLDKIIQAANNPVVMEIFY